MIRNSFLLIILFILSCSSVGTISKHSSSLEVYSMGLDRVVLQPHCTTIAIQEQSNGFLDLLTPATMNGRVRSVPDQTTARQIATAAELLR